MTDILPWLAANWLMLVIGLAFMLFLIISTAWAVSWYFWRWVVEAEREPEALPVELGFAFGDVIHVPDDYWQRVAAKEGKRGAA